MHLKKLSSHLNLCCRFPEFSPRDISNRRWCHTRRRKEDLLHRRSSHMSAWQVTSFANGGKVELVKNVEIPIITNSHQVLVKVAYSSVNPLDVEMIRGFGNVLLRNMRLLNSFCNMTNNRSSHDLPITLGRDFSGIVVAKGSAVTKFQVGDEVFGVIKPEQNGCHAEYALAHESLTLKKPHHLSLSKASAILYTTLTAWSALRISSYMYSDFSTDYPVLVIGASGGVGQAAVQLLKEWKCNVVATCRKDAISTVEKFHPDIIIDYTAEDYLLEIKEACRGFLGKYFIVLDAAGLSEDELIKYRDVIHEDGTIVTLRSPLLPNIDQYGLLGGGIKTVADLIKANLNYGSQTPSMKFKWGYFAAPPSAMDEIENLVKDDKLNPEIEKVYTFPYVDQAYEHLKAGHLRGKIIISVGEGSSE